MSPVSPVAVAVNVGGEEPQVLDKISGDRVEVAIVPLALRNPGSASTILEVDA